MKIRILHILDIRLNDILKELEMIKKQGFNCIQISPIQPLKNENDLNWWMAYQPIGYRIGNRYGNEEELIELCRSAAEYGIKIIADVVLNHMGGKNNNDDIPNDNVDKVLRENKLFWKRGPILTKEDYKNRQNVINGSIPGIPAINTNNLEIQKIIIEFLDNLVKCGVKGFRFDCAKHIALPEEGGTFWNNVLKKYKENNLILIGEVIYSNQELIDKYVSLGLHIVIHPNDKIVGDKIIMSVENHDSYLSKDVENTNHLLSEDINQLYINLTSKYQKTLYYIRLNDCAWKDELVKKANKK